MTTPTEAAATVPAANAQKTVVTGGVALGLAVAVWTLVMGFSGLYRHPTLNLLFFMVVPIQIAIVIWALRRGRDAGATWSAQVRTGTLLSAVAAPIVFIQSYLFTTVIFSGYFADLRVVHEKMLRDSGLDDAAVAQALADAGTPTSFGNAITGAIATIMTGVVVSSIAAVFIRAKR
jgi:hypothetical protein